MSFDTKNQDDEFDSKIESAVLVIARHVIDNMHMNDRIRFFNAITKGYCKKCGTANPYCQCWNDD